MYRVSKVWTVPVLLTAWSRSSETAHAQSSFHFVDSHNGEGVKARVLLQAADLGPPTDYRSSLQYGTYWIQSRLQKHRLDTLHFHRPSASVQCMRSAILLWQIRPSVRPSVCLSVCPMPAGTVSKRMNISSYFWAVW